MEEFADQKNVTDPCVPAAILALAVQFSTGRVASSGKWNAAEFNFFTI